MKKISLIILGALVFLYGLLSVLGVNLTGVLADIIAMVLGAAAIVIAFIKGK